MDPQLTVGQLLGANNLTGILGAPGSPGSRVHATKRTLPCTKLRNGTCPLVLGETLDCGKSRKIGCPFMGIDGKMDYAELKRYLADPELRELGRWIAKGLYGPNGVPKNR